MPSKAVRALLIGAELNPVAKAGGLADVLASLPVALNAHAQWVGVALPYYNMIPRNQLKGLKKVTTVSFKVGGSLTRVSVWKSVVPGSTVPLYLFKNNAFLSRGTPYRGASVLDPLTGKASDSRPGQRLRFLVFSHAVYHFLKSEAAPDVNIVHGQDYHTGALLHLVNKDVELEHISTVLTIHNLAVTGAGSDKVIQLLDWPHGQPFSQTQRKRKGGPRLLRLAIESSDKITTVSPQYAKEILTPEYGSGLERLLRSRRKDLTGILNGLDMDFFNPSKDKYIHHNYTASRLAGKAKNKVALQKKSKLPINADMPVIGLVHRLTSQKGLELLIALFPKLSKLPVQFVFVGTGMKKYEDAFKEAVREYPDQFYFHNKFDIEFGQQIYAGSDLFLMPSRFEPCGLSQLIAMRYGSVPIVRATGGLKNTVFEGKNGFVFNAYSSTALWKAIQRGINTYYNKPAAWKKIVQTGMQADYSWAKSAKEYMRAYTSTL